MKQYINELTPPVLASFKNPFSAEQLANADDEHIISTPQDYALLCQLDNSPAMPADFLAPATL